MDWAWLIGKEETQWKRKTTPIYHLLVYTTPLALGLCSQSVSAFHLPLRSNSNPDPNPNPMTTPGLYSGKSTLALVARASALTFGVVYGSLKLKVLKAKAKSQQKAEAKAHH